MRKRCYSLVFAMVILHVFASSSPKVTVSSSERLKPTFQRGISYRHHPYSYDSAFSNESLRRMVEANIEYVCITVWWLQEDILSTQIYAKSGWTATNESLAMAIQKAHELDMKVMLKPMVDPEDFYAHWRGEIPPSVEWFRSYRSFIRAYAQFAEEHGVDLLCIGCEFKGTEVDETSWRVIITEVRNCYSGAITYAATYDSYPSIRWWDALDYVGIDAYFPLTSSEDPTLEELKQGWSRIACDIENWHASKVNKPILFTEIGYRSGDGSNKQPWNWIATLEVDLQEQFDCYHAAFQVLWGRSWVHGFYWWIWESDPNAGGLADTDFTPQSKPVENLIRSWYSTEHILDDSSEGLQRRYCDLLGRYQTQRNLLYLLTLATIIFVTTTVYLSRRKPKANVQNE